MRDDSGLQLLLDSVAFTADRYSKPLYTGKMDVARFLLVGVATGTPVGNFYVQGCEDDAAVRRDRELSVYGTADTALWFNFELAAADVHNLGTGQARNAAGYVSWDGTNALRVWLHQERVPAVVRVFADYTSGGTASSLIKVYGRARE